MSSFALSTISPIQTQLPNSGTTDEMRALGCPELPTSDQSPIRPFQVILPAEAKSVR